MSSLNARNGHNRREMMSAMKLPNGGRAHEGARPAWQPIPAWRWMLAAAAAVVITAFVVTIWLLTIADHAKPGTDRANSRLDAVRTGLAAGAGAGAAVGLMLAFRRQHHQEIATDLSDRDATERRITELYTKAVEQLGSDKAPVRLGGLYALERLAQDNPAQRQTIVNVICAYLRMPFSPTEPDELEGKVPRDLAKKAEAEARVSEIRNTWWQERQVRLTAQRILAEHLRDDSAKDQQSTDPPRARFWPGIRLDLAGATLIDFNLGNGVMADASFSGATFSGDAWFVGATFSSEARFGGAVFSGEAQFGLATFSGPARFGGAIFSGDAQFVGTIFGDAQFVGATFGGYARFDGAVFGLAWFGGATFGGPAWFGGATFGGPARFGGTTFSSDARFLGATFTGGADVVSFERSCVLSPGAQHVWPTGWCLGPDDSGGHTVVRANDDGRS
jgi:uncharacterized protein YjbI with pentapeptide repeats